MSKDSIGQKDEYGIICTCTEECKYNCKGECGCGYCKNAWQDYLSGAGDW